VEWTQEKSRKKNVFQLNTLSDLQMLFQSDDKDSAMEWFNDIRSITEQSYPVSVGRFCVRGLRSYSCVIIVFFSDLSRHI